MGKIKLRYIWILIVVTAFVTSTQGRVTQGYDIMSWAYTTANSMRIQGQHHYVDSLKYIRLEDDGIWTVPDGYCFYVKDDLGNVRSVHNQNGRCIQTNQYYPFGKVWDDYIWNGSTQPFRFGGKELDKMHGLEWYDFGARMYDPGIGRFTSMDPKADLKPWQSPYLYGRNNPLRYVDPDGKEERDKIMGALIGTATDIIPFSTAARSWYTPTDAADYNAALQFTDNAFIAIGESMTDAGKGGAAVGTAVAATGGMLVVGSGGSAVIVGGAAVAAGATLTGISSISGAAGTFMKMNATNNKAKGYDKGASKNERHGDGGGGMAKVNKQIESLTNRIQSTASKREKVQLKNKIDRIKKNAEKKRHGEEHSKANKR